MVIDSSFSLSNLVPFYLLSVRIIRRSFHLMGNIHQSDSVCYNISNSYYNRIELHSYNRKICEFLMH